MRVKIKEWEDMEEEFGLAKDGQIKCKYTFITEMEEIMPEDRIIEVSKPKSWYIWEGYGWSISEDMIEAYLD